MKQTYRQLLKTFFEDYSNELGNRGCNDLKLPNTPENRDLVKRAHIWNCKGEEGAAKDIETWVKPYEETDLLGEPKRADIYTSDFLIFDYLTHEALEELWRMEDLMT